MEVPLAFFQQQQKESGEPAGGAQGGWRWRGGGALIFEQEVYCQQLESVFGGVLFTQCGDIPLLMTGSKIFEIMQESESDS